MTTIEKFTIAIITITSLFISSCAILNPPQQKAYNPEDVIFWNDTTKLRWEDFRGTPIYNNNQSCEILVQMPSYMVKGNLFLPVNTTVECFFDKKRSWVNQKLTSKYTLLYTQTMFDIYELFARKLRKKLAEANYGIVDLYGMFTSLVSVNNDELMEEIKKYRTATSSGQNESAIIFWSNATAEQLKIFEKYKSQNN